MKIQWILGKHNKPLTDGEIVKECMDAACETFLDGKERHELREKIKQTPLSAATATRRAEMLAQNVQSQLDAAIHTAPCVALVVDESTDINDNAQFVVYIRFYHAEKKDFIEDILGVTALTTHTRGEYIYLAIKEMLMQRGISLKHVVSITTDGAPSMIGKEKGAVNRMKEDNPDLCSYHCIIHQSVLCSTLSEE